MKGTFSEYLAEEEKEEKQSKLKKKHKINNKEVVVVEKKFINYFFKFIRVILTIVFFGLATFGLIALLYDVPREYIVEELLKTALSLSI